MRNATPFFAGFHRMLFGRAQRSAQDQLRAQALALEEATLSQLGRVCAPWVPARLLKPAESGDHSRQRFFPQGLTFWAFLSQVLSPESPCRETLRKVQAWYVARRLPRPGSGTAAYCNARAPSFPRYFAGHPSAHGRRVAAPGLQRATLVRSPC